MWYKLLTVFQIVQQTQVKVVLIQINDMAVIFFHRILGKLELVEWFPTSYILKWGLALLIYSKLHLYWDQS